MRKINYYKKNIECEENIIIYPIGDLHIGHQNCDEAFIEDYINTLSIVPEENNRILLMGDLLDCGIKTAIGGSVYEQKLTMQQQIDRVIELLKPVASQIDGMVQGNHEYRIYKETGIDICKILSDSLDIPYFRYTGVVTYSIHNSKTNRAININVYHGKSGGGVENALRKCKEMANKVNADIYLMGHCHHNAHTKRCFKQVDSRNNKIADGIQHFVLTGHALDYDESYADQANLEISVKGFPIITLVNDGSKRVEIS